MAKIDEAKLKHIISTIKASPPPKRRPLLVRRPPISKHRLAAAKMFEATLAEAGLDVAKFNKLLAQDQLEAREFLKKESAKSARDSAAAKIAHRQRVEANLKVAKLLTSDFKPNVNVITEPFYISNGPKSSEGILKSGTIEPGGSNIKILVDTDANDPNYTGGVFTFWYLWENDGPLDVVISALSNLVINATWSIEAFPGELWGLFGSDSASFSMYAYIDTFRYSGWGTDPTTGQSNDNTYYPGSVGPGRPVFDASVPENGSYSEQGLVDELFCPVGQGPISVPAGAVALFPVNFELDFEFSSGGGNSADSIEIDLNNEDFVHGVFCNSLSVLTWLKIPPFHF
jgi:hypothetical protein